MFLSFIIDTFGELRNKNAENTDDKDNKCFICQISRDECLMKNIDQIMTKNFLVILYNFF